MAPASPSPARDDRARLERWLQYDRSAGSDSFGIFSNQDDEFNSVDTASYGSTFGAINTLYSYIYIKSDTFGTLNWGHLSPASDNPAVLADISGTVIESNFVGFEGGGFFMRQNGVIDTSIDYRV